MSLLKTALVIAGVGAGGIALAHVASGALNPGQQKVQDPGAQPASGTSSGTITKRQQLQQLQADLAKEQTLLDDAKHKLDNAKSQAGSACQWIYDHRQWCSIFCDIGTQDRAANQCRRYVTDQSSDLSLVSQSSYYQSTAKPSVQALRAKVQGLEADAKRYKAKVASIQSQIDNLNAQGVY